MTPRSMTSKLLHCRTTPTMFLPMSWTSPLTVAMLLKDFNEIDSALADGKKLFSSITDLKEIEERFGLADEDMSPWRMSALSAAAAIPPARSCSRP